MKYLILFMILFSVGFAFGEDDCEDVTPTEPKVEMYIDTETTDNRTIQTPDRVEYNKAMAKWYKCYGNKDNDYCETDDYKDIRTACSKLGHSLGEDCVSKLSECKKCNAAKKQTRSCSKKDCGRLLDIASEEEIEEALEKEEETMSDAEDRISNLQDDLQEMQNDSVSKKQDKERQIQELQTRLSKIPQEATALQLENKNERKKLILDHMDRLNQVMDELTALNNQVTDAENALINARKGLLDQCENEARGIEQKRTDRNNQRRLTRTNVLSSLSAAMQTTSTKKCKVANTTNRKECNIVKNFIQCQKTRTYQEGLAQAKRAYKRTLQEIQSRKASVERQAKQLNNRLEANLESQTELQQLQIAQLAQEQSSISQQIMQLQKQVHEDFMLAQQQMQQKEQQIMQEQMQMNMFTHNINSFGNSKKGAYSEKEVESIKSALVILGAEVDEDDDLEDNKLVKNILSCKGKARGTASGAGQ